MDKKKAQNRAYRGGGGGFPIREDGVDLIEVHVGSICVRDQQGTWQVLAAKRSPHRALFPNYWECGGGAVRRGESLTQAIHRQIFEEFGLEAKPMQILAEYQIHTTDGQKVIPGIRYLCLIQAGRVHLNRREFTKYQWLNLPLAEDIEWIPGIREVIEVVTEHLGIGNGRRRQQKPRIGFGRGTGRDEPAPNEDEDRRIS